MDFLQKFTFASGKSNKVVDALSKVSLILQEIKVISLGFEILINIYKEDVDLKDIYLACENLVSHNRNQWLDYMLQEGLLFRNSKLCIPKCPMRENLIQEKHNGGLSGHCGQDKTFSQLSTFYIFP